MVNVSFSGGRSSAMMLHILKETYKPNEYAVVFANTGKEKPETLDFIHRIEKEKPKSTIVFYIKTIEAFQKMILS